MFCNVCYIKIKSGINDYNNILVGKKKYVNSVQTISSHSVHSSRT